MLSACIGWLYQKTLKAKKAQVASRFALQHGSIYSIGNRETWKGPKNPSVELTGVGCRSLFIGFLTC